MPTILHVSDVHFGPPFRPGAARAILAHAASSKPDLVVISGDLTQRAKPSQFQQARVWLEAFEQPTIVVPGNHDVPMYRFWERLAAPYRAWSVLGRQRESSVSTAGVWAAGIDTSRSLTIKHGRVGSRRLAEVVALTKTAPADAVKVAVAHHPMTPPPRFGEQRVAGGSRTAVGALLGAGFELVLGGHEHRFWVARSEDYWPGLEGLLHVHSGTSSSSRGRTPERGKSSAVWLEIDERTIRVSRLVFEERSERFDADLIQQFPRRH